MENIYNIYTEIVSSHEESGPLSPALLLSGIRKFVQAPTTQSELASLAVPHYGHIVYDEFEAWQSVVWAPMSLSQLRQALWDCQGSIVFKQALFEIDAKRDRAIATIVEAQALGFPPEDYADDVSFLQHLNMVAEENRDLLHELQALTITEEMTLEEAQNVVRKARDMRPWLPWAPQESAPPIETPPIEPTPEREPTKQLSPPAGFTVTEQNS